MTDLGICQSLNVMHVIHVHVGATNTVTVKGGDCDMVLFQNNAGTRKGIMYRVNALNKK